MVALLLGAFPTLAQDAVRSERVTFEEGHAARSLVDAIAGFERVHYVVSARAGQMLTVSLASSNLSNTFDIAAPMATEPFFVGGDAGNTHSFRVPASGDYIIDVHLLRFAARDYQSAQYTLNVALAE